MGNNWIVSKVKNLVNSSDLIYEFYTQKILEIFFWIRSKYVNHRKQVHGMLYQMNLMLSYSHHLQINLYLFYKISRIQVKTSKNSNLHLQTLFWGKIGTLEASDSKNCSHLWGHLKKLIIIDFRCQNFYLCSLKESNFWPISVAS